MSSTPSLSLRALPLVVLLAGCASQAPQVAAPVEKPPPAMAAPAAPVAPVAPATPVMAESSSEAALTLTAQPGWIAEEPSNERRMAQFRLPRAEKDAEDATLVVFFFGGTGGTREANIERWANQFEQPDGVSSSEVLQSSSRSVGDLEVFDVTLSGTYVAETAPGSSVRVNKPGWRMLASIVETSEGPWYFKLVGPEATVEKWAASYAAYLDSVKPSN
jgi:hypothetical protein